MNCSAAFNSSAVPQSAYVQAGRGAEALRGLPVMPDDRAGTPAKRPEVPPSFVWREPGPTSLAMGSAGSAFAQALHVDAVE